MPDKLLHGVHPAENLFEKLIMGVGDFRHKQNLPHLLCKSSSHIGDPGSCELGKYRTQGLRVPERTLFLILFRHFTERYLFELIDKIFTKTPSHKDRTSCNPDEHRFVGFYIFRFPDESWKKLNFRTL